MPFYVWIVAFLFAVSVGVAAWSVLSFFFEEVDEER